MFYKNRKKFVISLLFPLVIGLSFISQLAAQPTELPDPILIQVNQLEIKPDKLEQFRTMHRDVFIPAGRASGTPWRLTSTVTLGNTLTVVVASPIPNMAFLDTQGGPGASALEGQLALDIWSETVQSRRSFIVTSRPDMSLPPTPQTGLTVQYRFQVKMGMIPQFVALWNGRVIPALQSSGVEGTAMFQTVTGGLVGEFFSVTPVANFASADGPGPFGGLTPQDAGALNADLSNLLDELEIVYNSVDQELSYGLPGLQP